LLDDGESVAAGGVIATVRGPFGSILSAERTALNFLSHLSGVATLTDRYVERAPEREECRSCLGHEEDDAGTALRWRRRRCVPAVVTTTAATSPRRS
jgi:hypothetical protein